jgi:hypothetical protein
MIGKIKINFRMSAMIQAGQANAAGVRLWHTDASFLSFVKDL